MLFGAIGTTAFVLSIRRLIFLLTPHAEPCEWLGYGKAGSGPLAATLGALALTLVEENLLAHAPELFLLLRQSNLFHAQQIPSVEVAASGTDPGDQSHQDS
jgi:hypothetical protein